MKVKIIFSYNHCACNVKFNDTICCHCNCIAQFTVVKFDISLEFKPGNMQLNIMAPKNEQIIWKDKSKSHFHETKMKF